MERVGIIQMTSGPDIEANLAEIARQCQLAAAQGVQLVVTPENAVLFAHREAYHQHAERLNHGPIQHRLAGMARQYQVSVVLGSMPIRTENSVTTTSLLFSPRGELLAYYDKLHMFDVDVTDGHGSYRESDTFSAGERTVAVGSDIGTLGLSICYDVRFPALYQALAEQGAEILLVPAAFTAVTGAAHWETLLKARAIETQCWVIACGQTGTHPCGRQTWGHSMVISPWGEVWAQLGDEPGLLVTEIDLSQCRQVRQNMPLTQHNRFQIQLKRKQKS